MARAKTIKIHLPDGDASGVRIAHISSSNIQAVAFSKAQLADVIGSYPELRRPGVYILIGVDETDAMRPVGYIGESEDVAKRLVRHNANKSGPDAKPFWRDTVVLLTKDEHLTKSHVRYAESCLVRSTGGNVRWLYPNRQLPSEDAGRLPAWDRLDIDDFVEQSKTLVSVLGWDMFRNLRDLVAPTPASESTTTRDATTVPLFTFKGDGYSAVMQPAKSGDFIVKQNSCARVRVTPTIPANAASLRTALMDSGVLRLNGDCLVFTSDYAFPSASSAAAVVIGASANGRALWKHVDDGKTFDDWETSQM